MFKGCQKKIVILKNTKSNIFDEAYFVLKNDIDKKVNISKTDMIKEANRIIQDNLISVCCNDDKKNEESPQKKGNSFYLKWFIAGASSCGVIMSIVLYIINFNI